MKHSVIVACFWFLATSSANAAEAQQASFFRGVNLAGPAVTIDGQAWIGDDDPLVQTDGGAFENQNISLVPKTDRNRASMIRSSRWGGNLNVKLTRVPDGWYQVFVYVWEDNHTTDFQLQINRRQVIERFSSGAAGRWHRLGPFPTEVTTGSIVVSARGGDANVSGIEVWQGLDPLPEVLPSGFVESPTADQLAFFESSIRPLLIERCYECHSADADDPGGNLLLDSRKGLIVGGDTEPAVIAGDPAQSLLIHAVTYKDSRLRMPPDEPLSAEEIRLLEQWIAMGMPDPRTEDTIAAYKERTAIDWEAARDFWSLRPVRPAKLPAVEQSQWPLQPLDHFVLAKLESQGITPAVDATKAAWLRRATYDLIGLPPSSEELDAFLQDDSPEAYDRVVDRLLGSRHYGERWGRHWLDVIRYSDTAGDNSDFPIPQMVLYRDWVFDAFNRDLPYDDFVRQQLAGDLLPASSAEQKRQQTIATGYIANARRFGSRVDDYPQHLTIEDTIDNLGRTFLGATLNCARCHDHKFDPFTMSDYYGIYGIFHSTRYPWPGIELDQQQRDLVPLVDDATYQAARQRRDAELAKLQAELKRLQAEQKDTPKQSELWEQQEQQIAAAQKQFDKQRKLPLPIPQAYAVTEGKRIEDSYIQLKGDPAKLGERVPRHFLTVLGGQALQATDQTSGRLQLAEWILDEQNPLSMRVLVNRVWLHHFGQGIVPTPNDFGRQGKPPTHPELLDWLVQEFMASGYSIKSLHRTIMLSHTYRQSSYPHPRSLDADPNNLLLSWFPRRRLDAESIRDTILMLGGTLDLSPGKPHPFPPQTEWSFTQHKPFKSVYETNHRSAYLMTQRIQRHPFLAIFDGADPAASTPQRLTSTTPVQSLYFLNDPAVHEQATRFAEQIVQAAADDEARIRFAYRRLFSRDPDIDELQQSLQYLHPSSQSTSGQETSISLDVWTTWVRVLFRLNEFVYVD